MTALRAALKGVTRWAPASAALLMIGCAAAPSNVPGARPAGATSSAPRAAAPAPAPAPQPAHPTESERRKLFQELVAAVRKYHVFAPQTERNLGRTWADDLPILEREIAAADTRSKLIVALARFGNSLHNPHCRFRPNEPAEPLVLGFTVDVEWTSGEPTFYVARVDDPALAQQLAPGDIVVSADGIAARDILQRLSLQSQWNNWRGIAEDEARFLTRRSSYHVDAGASSTWLLAPRGGGPQKQVTATWKPKPRSKDSLFIDYASTSCAGLPERNYGPYTMIGQGRNFCLYAAREAPYDATPIVRHFSFIYDPGPADDFENNVRTDQRLITHFLKEVPGARGVVLDLRDNEGGNEPYWFMDWYAPAPYVDHFIFLRLVDDLGSKDALKQARISGPAADFYLDALRRRAPGQELTPRRPFYCQPEGCDWDNRFTPSHPVTTLPVALLVGSRCNSSCATVAQQFDDHDFGPLIGEPTAAGFTGYRLRYRVKTPDGEELGQLSLALSYEVSGKTGKEVEAVLPRLDYPVDRSFANRERYDQLLVDAARRAFREFPFPPRQTAGAAPGRTSVRP
ncbi:S41 family peptidase [Sorangium sp. So ce1389]|uniref:S41 family peptidase n=1 Tax=Sorangium sp. So ce1389 TaxID=3133336 RepID=UPI003F62B64F